MSVSNPQLPTPPLHAEVRAAVEKFYRDYETDMAAVVPPIGTITDFKEQQRQSEHFWNKRMREAETAILQAVADALLKEIQPLKDKPEKYVRMNSECLEGHTIALDAVTRVIGELGGGKDA